MSDKKTGLFSLALKAVRYQIETLFSDCGGSKAEELLNRLSELSESRRNKALDCFNIVLNELSQDANSGISETEFEKKLYGDLVLEIEHQIKTSNFHVISGGCNKIVTFPGQRKLN